MAGVLVAGPAWAHSSVPGIRGFYVGLLHPLITPVQVLALAPLALLLGQHWTQATKSAWLAFAACLVAGLAAAFALHAVIVPDWLLMLAAVAAGGLAALARPLPPAVLTALAAIIGVLLGFASLPDPGLWFAMVVTGFGSITGTFLLVFYIGAGIGWLRQRFDRPWLNIGVRVAGSWVVAIACLTLTLAYVSGR